MVSGKLINLYKEIKNNNAVLVAESEYTFPDNTKKTGRVRYPANVTKEKILNDIEIHCKTITKYYIQENEDLIRQKSNELIDDFITNEDIQAYPAVNVTSITISELENLTLNAEGTIKDNYR